VGRKEKLLLNNEDIIFTGGASNKLLASAKVMDGSAAALGLMYHFIGGRTTLIEQRDLNAARKTIYLLLKKYKAI
jgi:hypothetical protein